MSAPIVVDVPQQRRFEISVDGELVGFAEYVRKGGRYFFVHAEINPDRGERGLGSALARGSLDAVRATGDPVVPLCSFIAGWIERHPEYADLVDQELLDRLDEGR